MAGAETYGAFTLVISIASVLTLPMYILLQWATKYIASEESPREKDIYFSSVFWLIALIFPVLVGIYFFFGKEISSLAWFDSSIYGYVLCMVVLLYLNSFFESMLRAYNRFDTESVISSLAHAGMFIVFLMLSYSSRDILMFFIPYSLLYVAKIVMSFSSLLAKIRFTVSLGHLKRIYGYGAWIFLIFIFQTLLTYIDKIAINKFLSLEMVGIFQAYYDSSVIVTATVIGFMLSVLSTKLFMITDKKPIAEKLKKIAHLILLFDVFLLPFVIFAILRYGFHYPVDWTLIAAFTLLTAVSNKLYIWNTFCYTFEIAVLKKIMIVLLGVIIINLVGNFLLVPHFGILASIGTTVLGDTVMLLYLLREIEIYLRKA